MSCVMEKFLITGDNHTIAINHYDSDRESVLVICPGWAMTKDSRYFRAIAEDFYKFTDVIAMDFRGHGRSSGYYTFSAREIEDLKAVVSYAKSQYKDVHLLGFSLGAAISIIYTAEYKNIATLTVVSPPCDFMKIENHFFRKEAFIPTLKKFEFRRSLSIRPGNIFCKKIRPIDVIDRVAPIPVLFIAGGKDATVHPWHVEELFKKAVTPKVYEFFEQDFHAEDLYINSRERFLKVCNNIMTCVREFNSQNVENNKTEN